MHGGKDLTKHDNAFNQAISVLGQVKVQVEDEDNALLLLISLAWSYKNSITTLAYWKTHVSLSKVNIVLLWSGWEE